MKRVYVAGAISARQGSKQPLLESLSNIKKGINEATHLICNGYAVFCPHLDFLFSFGSFLMDETDYKDNSMAWLEVSDAVYILPNSDESIGTIKEIARAKALSIPVFYNIKDLNEWGTK